MDTVSIVIVMFGDACMTCLHERFTIYNCDFLQVH
jgi:hypothetical protein